MFKEHLVYILVLIAFILIIGPIVDKHPLVTPDNEPIEEIN